MFFKLFFISCLYLLSTSILRVESLNCVVCTQCPDPWSNVTNPATACTAGLDTCLSSYLRYPGGSFIIKQCTSASLCASKSYGIAGYGFWVTCCTTDGCNSGSRLQNKISFSLAVLILYLAFYFKQ